VPAAKRFADRTNGRIQLATSQDLVRWCSDATDGVVKDRSKLVAPDQVSKIIGDLSSGADPRILHANVGVTMIMNVYSLVPKETNHAALWLSCLRSLSMTTATARSDMTGRS
jgi:hypothetical protein